MSDRSRPEEKLKKFHILILVISKTSLNLFIVNFLCQLTGHIHTSLMRKVFSILPLPFASYSVSQVC
jgi:hypothetical protein